MSVLHIIIILYRRIFILIEYTKRLRFKVVENIRMINNLNHRDVCYCVLMRLYYKSHLLAWARIRYVGRRRKSK